MTFELFIEQTEKITNTWHELGVGEKWSIETCRDINVYYRVWESLRRDAALMEKVNLMYPGKYSTLGEYFSRMQ